MDELCIDYMYIVLVKIWKLKKKIKLTKSTWYTIKSCEICTNKTSTLYWFDSQDNGISNAKRSHEVVSLHYLFRNGKTLSKNLINNTKFDNLKEKLYCMIVRYNLFRINVLCVGTGFLSFWQRLYINKALQ